MTTTNRIVVDLSRWKKRHILFVFAVVVAVVVPVVAFVLEEEEDWKWIRPGDGRGREGEE